MKRGAPIVFRLSLSFRRLDRKCQGILQNRRLTHPSAESSPPLSQSVPYFFQFPRSPQRLNFLAKRFGRFHYYVSEPPVDLSDAHNATYFIRDFVMDDVIYTELHGIISLNDRVVAP